MYACATAMFAVAMPLQKRAMNNTTRLCATPSSAMPAAVAAILQISTGRRPTRSDRRPQMGMNRNCISE